MTTLESLSDQLAIAEAVARLATTQDAHDWAGLRALLTERVHLDLSRHLDVPAVEVSADDFTSRARAVAEGFTVTHHLTSNLVIDLAGTQATCSAHVLAYHYLADRPAAGTQICVMRGTWDLRMRKTGTRWLIERIAVTRTAPLEGNAHLYTHAATAKRSS
ncbi:nuclear transport factor 2 family protein [Streptomyces sp. NPDC088725]|uniref:nuclear transport factor 2 family protein n=1 Tax=Streptomyces sp. NPDC088725 TaxID=3365873 RepID=UPI00381C2A18